MQIFRLLIILSEMLKNLMYMNIFFFYIIIIQFVHLFLVYL